MLNLDRSMMSESIHVPQRRPVVSQVCTRANNAYSHQRQKQHEQHTTLILAGYARVSGVESDLLPFTTMCVPQCHCDLQAEQQEECQYIIATLDIKRLVKFYR